MKRTKARKKHLIWLLAGLCILVSLTYFVSVSTTQTKQRFFVTGNLLLKIRSCGCSLRDLGGAARRYAYLQSVRNESDWLVDFGAAFTEESPAESQKPHASLKRKLFSDILGSFGYDLVHTVESDQAILKQHKNESLNLLNSSTGVSEVVYLNKEAAKLAFVGVSKNSDEDFSLLRERLLSIPSDTPAVIFSYLAISDSILLTKKLSALRPVLVLGNDVVLERYYSEKIGNSLYVTGGDRGRFLTVLDVNFTYNFWGSVSDVGEAASDFVSIAQYHEKLPAYNKINDVVLEWEAKNGPIEDSNH